VSTLGKKKELNSSGTRERRKKKKGGVARNMSGDRIQGGEGGAGVRFRIETKKKNRQNPPQNHDGETGRPAGA